MQREPIAARLVTHLLCAGALTLAGCAGWRHGATLRAYQGQLHPVKNGGSGAARLQIESDYDSTVRDFVQQNGEPDDIYVVDKYTLKLIYADPLDRVALFERRWYKPESQVTVTVGPDAVQSAYHEANQEPARAQPDTRPDAAAAEPAQSETSSWARYAPWIAAIGAALSTPSAGGAGPIIGNALQAAAGAQTTKLMLFGGSEHQVYLGCLTCPESARDSILNEFGPNGSGFSAPVPSENPI